ncbi:hypothetical protein ACFSJU_15545 [Paradesertivirga mongoliensis]|uniref:DUF5018 domain-containing protein n=1 Tax=Paradesertivirga mongoliensis TaxID=2100740 RepID=A0ABW4ZPU7_9SPHI|nr:hypothetical protein [Pedobacter mongoliensis]
MKNKKNKLLSLLFLTTITIYSCKKDSENIFNMFDEVDVVYTSALNSDEILLDFEISTPTSNPTLNQMYTINISETGSTTPVITRTNTAAERNKYVATIKVKKGSPQSTYEVWATNASGAKIAAATVLYHGNPLVDPKLVSDYTNVNDGETVYIDYSITSSNEDMHSVVVEKVAGSSSGNPERTATVVSDESERRSYSRTLKLTMQRDGKSTYRVYALNEKGHYIGDGYKEVTIEVNPSYKVIASRRVYAPDTLTKVNPSFYSISKGTSFSYTEGQANSADIDFGIWRTPDPRPAHAGRYIYNYYSLSATTNPFPTYDISAWTKRATVFSAPVTGGTNTFLYTLVSGSVIEEQAKARTLNVTSTNFTTWQAGLAAGNVVYFKTPEGKYGAFLVNGVASDYENKAYVSIDVKIQN